MRWPWSRPLGGWMCRAARLLPSERPRRGDPWPMHVCGQPGYHSPHVSAAKPMGGSFFVQRTAWPLSSAGGGHRPSCSAARPPHGMCSTRQSAVCVGCFSSRRRASGNFRLGRAGGAGPAGPHARNPVDPGLHGDLTSASGRALYDPRVGRSFCASLAGVDSRR